MCSPFVLKLASLCPLSARYQMNQIDGRVRLTRYGGGSSASALAENAMSSSVSMHSPQVDTELIPGSGCLLSCSEYRLLLTCECLRSCKRERSMWLMWLGTSIYASVSLGRPVHCSCGTTRNGSVPAEHRSYISCFPLVAHVIWTVLNDATWQTVGNMLAWNFDPFVLDNDERVSLVVSVSAAVRCRRRLETVKGNVLFANSNSQGLALFGHIEEFNIAPRKLCAFVTTCAQVRESLLPLCSNRDRR